MPTIRIVRLHSAASDLELPSYATPGAAGADVRACAPEGSIVLPPGRVVAVPTGLALEIPDGFEVQVRARSGLALHHGIGLPNGPGTIDSDYRGELKILLMNWGAEPYTIRHGDRVAQLVVAPVARVEWMEAESLAGPTSRGAAGFGHTGRL